MPEASGHAPSSCRIVAALIVLLIGVASAACGGDTLDQVVDTIDREAFIGVYVDLRSVALRKRSLKISAVERDSVLAMHEVSEEDLRLFLEAYQAEAAFMRDLWNEVEARISTMMQGSERDG